MSPLSVETIHFSPKLSARSVRVNSTTPVTDIVETLELPIPRALIVLNGGTAPLASDLQAQLGLILSDGLACFAGSEGITLITGGSDAGVFHLLGQGVAKYGRSAPCIGVAVDSQATWPAKIGGDIPLEPHHSVFVLVEGDAWGDETDTMYTLAAALGAHCPNLTVFAGGGQIACSEMEKNVTQGRTMVMLRGSGRATDAVLDVLEGNSTPDERTAAIARDGKIVSFDIRRGADEFMDLLRTQLAVESSMSG